MDVETASKTIGTCRTLRRYCNGITTRLLYINSTMLSQGGSKRPLVLQGAEYASKMRKKLESSFPEPPDVCRTPQFEMAASQTLSQLQEVFDCFDEASILKEGMLQALLDISCARNGIPPQLKLDLTPVLMSNFMGLLVSYAKLHIVVSRIEERKSVLGLYFAAALSMHRRSDASHTRISAMACACDDPLRTVATELHSSASSTIHECVLQALGEIGDTIRLYFDEDRLHSLTPLNPIAGGDEALALPVSTPISSRVPTVSLHFELSRAGEYFEWVIYSALILPGVIFNSAPATELFSAVASELFMVNVYRGQSLNLHTEMDRLTAWFPPKGVSLPLLGKTKFKDYMKDLRKTVSANSGIKQKRRRMYLIGELETIRNIIRRVPGLLGPKFPVVFAALGMAKVEIYSYWRHSGLVVGKKGQDSSQFDDPIVSALIGSFDDVLGLVIRNSEVIRRYYAEYLRGAHMSALSSLISAVCSNPDVCAKLGQETVHRMLSLLAHFSFDMSSVEGEIVKPFLQEFRWDCDRLVGVLSDPRMNLMGGEVDALLRRLSVTRLHSQLVDGLPQILARQVELCDAWWHLNALKQDYSNCLYGREASMGQYAIAYLHTLLSSCNTVLPECPEEENTVSICCADTCEAMVIELADRVEQLLDLLVKETEILDGKTVSAEAFIRYERSQAASKARRGMQASQSPMEEPLPGNESSGEVHDKLQSLVGLQRCISHLLDSFNSIGRGKGIKSIGLVAHDRLIVPKEEIRSRVDAFFRSYLRKTIVLEDESRVARPTDALRAITLCISVLEGTLGGVGIDVGGIVRRVFLDECSQWTRTSDADAAYPTPNNRTVLEWVVKYYIFLIKRISPEGDLSVGAVYVGGREGFVSTQTASKIPIPVDLYLDKDEIRAFCCLFGGEGARAFEQELLSLISGRVREIYQLLVNMTPALARFKDVQPQEGSTLWHESLRSLSPLGKLLEHSIAIGMALTFRKLLQEALCEVCSKSMSGLHTTTKAACSMLDAAIQKGDGISTQVDLGPFESFASDLGLRLTTQDYGLEQSLELSNLNPAPWKLLPCAFAACFAADQWKKCKFIGVLEGYECNEHLAILAITSLFRVIFNHEDEARRALNEYLECAALTLLRMKLDCKVIYKDWKFPEMLAFMDLFVENCSEVDRSALEGFIPYSLTHAAYLEMSRTIAA